MFGGVGSFVLADKNLLGNLFSVFLFYVWWRGALYRGVLMMNLFSSDLWEFIYMFVFYGFIFKISLTTPFPFCFTYMLA